jgi:hypothetical protein
VAVAWGLGVAPARGQVWEQMREWRREWAHGLGQIPLVLGSMKNTALVTIVSSRQAHFMTSLLY